MARDALLGPKRVFFDRIVERSYWTWRRHPAVIVPSMLVSGLFFIFQAVVFLTIMSLESIFAVNGSLFQFLNDYQNGGIVSLFQDPRFSLLTIIAVALSVAALITIATIGAGFVYSSEYGTYIDAWNHKSVSIGSVLANGSRKWKAMSWTVFLSTIITWSPAFVGYTALLLSNPSSGSASGLILVIVSGNLLQPLLYSSLILSVFTVYVSPAVVVDGLSGLRAIRKSFDVAGHHLGTTLTYSIVRILLFLPLIISRFFQYSLATPLGVPLTSLIIVLTSFAFTPVLHMTKALIFYYSGPSVPEMSFESSNPIWRDVFRNLPRAAWKKVRLGLTELTHFVLGPSNIPFHLISIASFGLGIVLGYYVSNHGWASFYLSLGYQPGHGNTLFNRVVPPAEGIDIFLNNWYVAVGTAMSGIGFSAPSAVAILYTGFTVGRLAVPSLSPSLPMFFAAILPHGIIEIPSFVIAGSMGLKLGYATLKTRLQPTTNATSYLSNTARSTVYAVVGLTLLFLIAGLIEGDITPIIMRMFGWTF